VILSELTKALIGTFHAVVMTIAWIHLIPLLCKTGLIGLSLWLTASMILWTVILRRWLEEMIFLPKFGLCELLIFTAWIALGLALYANGL